MTLDVGFSAQAQQDLREIISWIADRAGEDVAFHYAQRIVDACDRIGTLPQIGTRRPELGRDVRSMPFERSATIFFRVGDQRVLIMRVLRKGRQTPRRIG